MKKTDRHQSARRRPLGPNEATECQLYVIELDESVLSDPAFTRANPTYREGQQCLYVGMTSLPLEERYLQHLQGGKNASRIAGFGRRLRLDLVPPSRPVRRTWALEREKKLARSLRHQGFAVWQA